MLYFKVYFCEAGLVTNDISLTAGNKIVHFTYIDSLKKASLGRISAIARRTPDLQIALNNIKRPVTTSSK